MIEWNVTKLMTKIKDKDKETLRKQKLKNLGEEIFKEDASYVFFDVCRFNNWCILMFLHIVKSTFFADCFHFIWL